MPSPVVRGGVHCAASLGVHGIPWHTQGVRFGLRLQVVLLLSGILALFVFPLHLATVAYTESAHRAGLQQQASDLLQTMTGALNHTSSNTAASREGLLRPFLTERVPVLKLETDHTSAEVTLPGFTSNIPGVAPHDRGLWVRAPLRDGSVLHALVVTPPSAFHRLNPLLVLYIVVTSIALLASVYYIVTYLIIRPLDRVSLAARNVMSAEHALSLPTASSLEFEGLHNSLRTMTERLRQDEAAQRQKVAEVQAAQDELKRAQAQVIRSERLASVGQLAAGLAHEIGNPIAAIIGLQDLILAADLPVEQQAEFVARMRKETERINRVLKDLLRFARSQPEPSSDPPIANLQAVVSETLSLLRPQPTFRNIDLVVDLDSTLPPVGAHHEPLTQIILNLLLNAAAACAGRGQIRIAASRSLSRPSHIEVAIEDSGHGVPEKLFDTLFEPFVSGKEVGEGTGLGLSVCRSLVEQIALNAGLDSSGATIDFDRTFKAGARFVVCLPAFVER
jgi:two-component system, NtrC family, sensor kinase